MLLPHPIRVTWPSADGQLSSGWGWKNGFCSSPRVDVATFPGGQDSTELARFTTGRLLIPEATKNLKDIVHFSDMSV